MRQLGEPYKRPSRGGWWLRWTDPVSHRRAVKSFPNKRLAEHFRSILYYRLNADVFVGVINIGLSAAIDEYLTKYKLRNLSPNSQRDAAFTLRRFLDWCGDGGTKFIGQRHFDGYISRRAAVISPHTLNKDIRNLKAFVGWARKARYITAEIELHKVKAPPIHHKALTTEQIRWLFSACPTAAWRVRILLSLVTGLRAGDIDRLKVADIDLDNAKIDTTSQKTGKVYIGRPLPVAALDELAGYLNGLDSGQVKLFADANVRKAWEKLRADSGITRQDLRRTFATLIQKVGSVGSAQALLEHCSPRTTMEFYTDRELLLHWRVNQLPVREWLG